MISFGMISYGMILFYSILYYFIFVSNELIVCITYLFEVNTIGDIVKEDSIAENVFIIFCIECFNFVKCHLFVEVHFTRNYY